MAKCNCDDGGYGGTTIFHTCNAYVPPKEYPVRRESPYVSDSARTRERERGIENRVGSYYCGDLGRWMKVGDSDYHRYYKPGMH